MLVWRKYRQLDDTAPDDQLLLNPSLRDAHGHNDGMGMAPVPRDETLVKAVARAYSWFEDIRMRRVSDLSEIAVREQLPRSYVQAHLPLAFLAPSIVGAILDGRQSPDLSLKQLMYRTDLVLNWSAQRQQLGFEN